MIELPTYSNGQIPTSELTNVGGSYFRNDAAVALTAMRGAYAAALGRTLIINDGYRDLAGQWDAWNAYQNGTGNLAAYPGTSNHGWAIAADFGGEIYSPGRSSAGHLWLRNNAANYGWWWAGANFSQVESWHWEFNGNYTPPAGRKKDDQMRVIRWATNGGQVFTVGQEFIKYETNPGQAQTMASILNGGPIIDVNHEGFNAIQLSMGIPWSGVVMATQGKGYTPDGVRVTTSGNIWSRVMEIKNK